MSDRIPIRIHRQNRRSLVMKLTPVGVVVFIPRRLKADSPMVQTFIENGMRQLEGYGHVSADVVSTQEHLRTLVRVWADRLGVQPGRVQFRDMYRKWGSCSSAGNITLNTALCRVPLPLADYVILHELVHLRVFNHGADFKRMMTEHMPDWRERAKALSALLGPRQPSGQACPDGR